MIVFWLWHLHALRPYLAGFGAGLAAFLGPLPGLLSPESRGKWLISVGMAAVIGLGTWYVSDQLQREKDHVEKQRDSFSTRLTIQQEFFGEVVKGLSGKERDDFLLAAGHRLAMLYPQPESGPISDLAAVIVNADHENGHALYFAGEEYRSLRDQTNMRGSFQRYLAAAEHNTEAAEGDYKACYSRPSGFCGERTAYVNHLMAADYYHEALQYNGNRRVEALRTAIKYEADAVKVSRFNRDGSLESSCELLLEARALLEGATSNADSVLHLYRTRYGACGDKN